MTSSSDAFVRLLLIWVTVFSVPLHASAISEERRIQIWTDAQERMTTLWQETSGLDVNVRVQALDSVISKSWPSSEIELVSLHYTRFLHSIANETPEGRQAVERLFVAFLLGERSHPHVNSHDLFVALLLNPLDQGRHIWSNWGEQELIRAVRSDSQVAAKATLELGLIAFESESGANTYLEVVAGLGSDDLRENAERNQGMLEEVIGLAQRNQLSALAKTGLLKLIVYSPQPRPSSYVEFARSQLLDPSEIVQNTAADATESFDAVLSGVHAYFLPLLDHPNVRLQIMPVRFLAKLVGSARYAESAGDVAYVESWNKALEIIRSHFAAHPHAEAERFLNTVEMSQFQNSCHSVLQDLVKPGA